MWWYPALLAAEEGGTELGEFFIRGVFKYNFFGHEVWITTTHIAVIIVMLALISISFIVRSTFNKAKEVPVGLQNIIEFAIENLNKFIRGGLGDKTKNFGNYVSTVFVFILACNVSGLLGLRNPTADYGVTLALALCTFFVIHVNSIRFTGKAYFKEYLEPFFPFLPINIVEKVALPVSLSLRLFANILSGCAIMSIVYSMCGYFAVIWPSFLHIYFDMFAGAIQTYVFCMLTMINLSRGTTVHEHVEQ